MAVTPDDVRHVAGLARLGIPEDALARYVEQLNGILSHMEVLQRVKGEAEATPPDAGMALREDRVAPVPLAIARERFAPRMRDGFFLVPRLATHEDAGEEP
ncbi:MAG: Asp-tRNA(Asn)/Glu-tRNA(Gln) amidotransferase subunit GatC [Gemmatimonadaceae bacterium]